MIIATAGLLCSCPLVPGPVLSGKSGLYLQIPTPSLCQMKQAMVMIIDLSPTKTKVIR